MAHLVAIDLPASPNFLRAVQHEWDAGNAILPIDRRLPAAARASLLDALAPDQLVDESGRHQLSGREVEPGDALVIASSGATGSPKGVVLTHEALNASAAATSAQLQVDANDTWVACLPLSHIGGFSVLTRALYCGSPLIIHDGFDGKRVEAAATQGATAVSLVATALRRIDASLFRVVLLGGSRPPDDRPPNVVAAYGLTETGSGVVYDGLPIAGVELEIAPDGEVLVRGPMLMRCYRDNSTAIDEEGWLHTGDSGYMTTEGRLQIAGRIADMIITGGENVWPEAVEAAIASHPTVRDVAVAGVADEEWGERVVAWIVPTSEPPVLADIRAHVAQSMPMFCAPKEIRMIDHLPRTALGKVQRNRLRTGD